MRNLSCRSSNGRLFNFSNIYILYMSYQYIVHTYNTNSDTHAYVYLYGYNRYKLRKSDFIQDNNNVV